MLPTFLVIGAAKCGTTSVCDVLSDHPQVFMTEPKEPHFFARQSLEEWLPWYESLFEGADRFAATGEGSVAYTLPGNVDLAARRIHEMLPDCRLIYMVRHPVRRLESDWKMRVIEGRHPGPLNRAVYVDTNLIAIGQYWSHLSVYRRLFDDSQILVCYLEDLARDADREMKRIFEHIGVDPHVPLSAVERTRNSADARRRTEALRKLGPIYSIARRFKHLIPQKLTDLVVDPIVARHPDPSIRWEEEALAFVTRELSDDALQLLRYTGKAEDYWRL